MCLKGSEAPAGGDAIADRALDINPALGAAREELAELELASEGKPAQASNSSRRSPPSSRRVPQRLVNVGLARARAERAMPRLQRWDVPPIAIPRLTVVYGRA